MNAIRGLSTSYSMSLGSFVSIIQALQHLIEASLIKHFKQTASYSVNPFLEKLCVLMMANDRLLHGSHALSILS